MQASKNSTAYIKLLLYSDQAEFAEKLCNISGYDSVFFGNSGAEANECAIKIARKYSFDKYGKNRHNIITLVNSFHGRTIATLSATGQDVFHNYFFPFLKGFINVVANDIDDLKSKLDDTVCALMMNYVQGEGGVKLLIQDFVNAIMNFVQKKMFLSLPTRFRQVQAEQVNSLPVNISEKKPI